MNQVTADMLRDEIQDKPQRVIVTNLDMEFGTMVWFLVKLTVAAIPAAIILTVIVLILGGIAGGILGSMF